MAEKEFINPSDEINEYFSEEALANANKDFSELFLAMFSEARKIAVEETGENIGFQIDGSAWERGKWYILRKRYPGRRGILLGVAKYATMIIPIGIGYGLSEVSNRYWLVIALMALFGVSFFVQYQLESRS